MKMKPCADQPCNDCPMRRKSMPGWLGAATPEQFIQSVHINDVMPCHQTVDYETDDWESQLVDGSSVACAGVAIYHANVLKSPRDRSVRTMKPDKVSVFASPKEFLDHHNKLGVTSGEVVAFDRSKKKLSR